MVTALQIFFVRVREGLQFAVPRKERVNRDVCTLAEFAYWNGNNQQCYPSSLLSCGIAEDKIVVTDNEKR